MGDGYRLEGVKSYVVDGHIADLLIVAARVAAAWRCRAVHDCRRYAGIERRLLKSMDPTRKLARIDFHGAQAQLLGSLNNGTNALARTLDQAAIALANEMIGGAQALFDSMMTT